MNENESNAQFQAYPVLKKAGSRDLVKLWILDKKVLKMADPAGASWRLDRNILSILNQNCLI